MKVLILGTGVAAKGCKRLLSEYNIPFDIKEISEVDRFDYELIVKSPGISLHDPIISKFSGDIISDIELAYRLARPRIIAVTGSNGKTSVVSTLEHVLKKKYKVIACGNIGYTLADALIDYPNYDYYIVECSSFQLETIKEFRPNIAVILNISLCHIDHHKNLKEYVNAKLNIYKCLGKNSTLIYNSNIPYLKKIDNSFNKINYSASSTISNIYKLKNRIYYRGKHIYSYKESNFKCENIMAVLAVLISLDALDLKKYIKSFKGVPFRLEKIGNHFYNDAKSTNCESTRASLSTLNNVHLICGGYDRGIPIILDEKAISRIKCVYAYGETALLIKEYCLENEINCIMCINLEEAFNLATSKIKKNDNVLYSPMFASFDQYSSYIERGSEFNKLYLEYKKKPKNRLIS